MAITEENEMAGETLSPSSRPDADPSPGQQLGPASKAECAAALKESPHFNSSLDHTGENLIVKQYVHIGVAVDTPNGLVVPVLRDADRKGLFQLAEELQELGDKARKRKLRVDDLEGGSFSISSLGGIGGTFLRPS